MLRDVDTWCLQIWSVYASATMGGMSTSIPEKVPEKGFYYHYKHKAEDAVNAYAYEVVGTARHSEDESYLVVYRPLYESDFLKGVEFCVRPLDMFVEDVTKEGKTFPRFSRITDPQTIAELTAIRDKMYPRPA
jgi:hypothetical protein